MILTVASQISKVLTKTKCPSQTQVKKKVPASINFIYNNKQNACTGFFLILWDRLTKGDREGICAGKLWDMIHVSWEKLIKGDKVGLFTGKLWNMIHVSWDRLTKGDKVGPFSGKLWNMILWCC